MTRKRAAWAVLAIIGHSIIICGICGLFIADPLISFLFSMATNLFLNAATITVMREID